MNDLHARISELIYGDGNELPWNRATQIANTILWELDLHQEWAYTKPRRRLSATHYRYVTQWIKD